MSRRLDFPGPETEDGALGSGSISSVGRIRKTTDEIVDEMLSPDVDGECPHCGIELPADGPPMCPRCGTPCYGVHELGLPKLRKRY